LGSGLREFHAKCAIAPEKAALKELARRELEHRTRVCGARNGEDGMS